MNKRSLGAFYVLIAFASLAVPVRQALCQPGELPGCSPLAPYFCTDASYFLRGGSHYIEVYFQICNDGLQFVRTQDGYRASADVLVVLLDSKRNQVAGDTYRIRMHTTTYDETNSLDSCVTRIMSFKTQPGDFSMAITVFDGDSRSRSMLEAHMHIPAIDGRPSISDVTFLRKTGGSVSERYEGFEPNTKRIYNSAADDIYFYYEVYHGDGKDSVIVSHEVVDENGKTVYSTDKTSLATAKAAYFHTLPSDSLSNGRYTLVLSIPGPDGKATVSRSKQFEVMSEASYFKENVEQAVAILTYVANHSFIEAFREADVEDRRRLWERFWREADPTPRTPKNEFFEEHMRRFRYANENFAASLADGWETDRGRIHILYGAPDEIEAHSLDMGRDPLEIWYYFSKGKRFVFVDETGFGDYVLVEER
jgi:GWxTD domain-containing protein